MMRDYKKPGSNLRFHEPRPVKRGKTLIAVAIVFALVAGTAYFVVDWERTDDGLVEAGPQRRSEGAGSIRLQLPPVPPGYELRSDDETSPR